MKKSLFCLLIAALFCAVVPITVFSATEAEKGKENNFHNYRWEIKDNALQSVATGSNTQNTPTKQSGNISNGTLSGARYLLEKEVNLRHDAPWIIEWKCAGNWSGMLFGSAFQSPSEGLKYLFRDTGTKLFAFGEYNGSWNNYGIVSNFDTSSSHLFRLENRIEKDGTNTVYFSIDGKTLDAMNHFYILGKDQNKIVNWASENDLTFSFIGTSSHPLSGMALEYLQVWENGHTHKYQSTVTPPTCTEEGFTTYTCDCGKNYVADFAKVLDHSYENGVCKSCGKENLNPYAGKTIACIGDSITAGVGVTKDQTDYVTLLAQALEMDYIRLGASGSTLCQGGHAACNITKLTEKNLAGAEVVTILMGINDFVQAHQNYYSLGTIDSEDSSTIYGALHLWCQTIEELRKTDSLKNTEFYFLTPLITSWNNSVTSTRDWNQNKTNLHGYTLRDLCGAIIEVCACYDIPVIDLNLISGLYYNDAEDNTVSKFGGDGAHPGTLGHQMMAKALENALLQNHLKNDHAHTYGSWITTTYPNCENGEQKRVCEICCATENKILEGGHHFENGVCKSCGKREIRSFRILDPRSGKTETFQFELGMTWMEWLNSSYNTGMGSAVAIWVSAGPSLLGRNENMDLLINNDLANYNTLICETDMIELIKHQ